MMGMPRAPGAFTTLAGGGAAVVPAAMWKLVGGRSTATMLGPDRSMAGDGATAATGVMAARTAGVFPYDAGAVAPTAPANTNGVIMAMPNTGVLARSARCRTDATAG